MPVQFLSAEWTQELEKRLNASEAFKTASASADVTIQNVINTPDGPKRYWMRFDSGSVKLEAGDAEKADATIEQDYDTAVALAKSELNPVSRLHDREDPHQRQHDAPDAAPGRPVRARQGDAGDRRRLLISGIFGISGKRPRERVIRWPVRA